MKNAAETFRLIYNLIRTGTIADVDHAAARARVQSGENLTDFLPWVAFRAGTTTRWSPPTVGEQIVLLSPGGDLGQGIILTGLYSDGTAAPSDNPAHDHTVYPDGTTLDYDHENHALTITQPADGASLKIVVNGTCSVDATHIDLGRPDALQKSVLGDNMAAAMAELIQKINASQVIGNLGAPTSPISAVTPVEVPNLVNGGNSYSTVNRNQ